MVLLDILQTKLKRLPRRTILTDNSSWVFNYEKKNSRKIPPKDP
jgi:hypothetical protein